jgi:hypothetical protein
MNLYTIVNFKLINELELNQIIIYKCNNLNKNAFYNCNHKDVYFCNAKIHTWI